MKRNEIMLVVALVVAGAGYWAGSRPVQGLRDEVAALERTLDTANKDHAAEVSRWAARTAEFRAHPFDLRAKVVVLTVNAGSGDQKERTQRAQIAQRVAHEVANYFRREGAIVVGSPTQAVQYTIQPLYMAVNLHHDCPEEADIRLGRMKLDDGKQGRVRAYSSDTRERTRINEALVDVIDAMVRYCPDLMLPYNGGWD